MRLKHIKLVGFKSFVDPTTVPFPHQMTCVVGPNGCGKSNVIDAVRWVLGESSAKNLRGDAMTDVIFNGSSARKPVSQASVELVFDNNSGRIQGEYANYAEISVKRLVTRDGRSDYFLNNSKCRRRDITDLFLGTGLGPRSYAIIEQGMISRLIESKPQELRVFLEEAAGISKYKERRRETENRMKHTRDNLDRLTDVREELGSQLEKLQRQAAAARRYKDLKSEERKYKAELQALRWLAYEQQAESLRVTIQTQETELEQWVASLRGSERGTTELREAVAETKQKLDEVQQLYYQLGNDITRTEHELHSERQQIQQREQQRQKLQDERTQLAQTHSEDLQQLEELEAQQALITPDVEQAEAAHAEAAAHYEEHETAWLQWQDDYQAHMQAQQQQREQAQQLELQQQRLRHQVERIRDDITAGAQQKDKLAVELTSLNDSELTQELAESEQSKTALQAKVEAAETAYLNVQQQLEQLNQDREALAQQQQQAVGKQSSLQHLLANKQRDDWPEQVGAWLAQHEVKPLGQVHQLLAIETDWQFAVEQVAQAWMNAWVLAKPPSDWPEQLGAQLVVLNATKAAPRQSLASKVTGELAQWSALHGIAAAADANEAQQLIREPQWHGAITPAGQFWSQAGYRAVQVEAADSTILQQAELTAVTLEIAEYQHQLDANQQRREQLQQERQSQQQELQVIRAQLTEVQAHLAGLSEQQRWQQQQRESLQAKLSQLDAQQLEWQEELQQLQLEQEELALIYEQQQLEQPQTNDDEWQVRRNELQQQRGDLRQAMTDRQQQLHTIKVQAQQIETQLQHQRHLLERTAQQQRQVEEQLAQVSLPDAEQHEQLEILALQLEELIQRRETVDEERRKWSNQLSEHEAKLNDVSQGAHGIQAQIDSARNKLQSSQMEMATIQERSRSVLAVLQDMQQPLKPILEQLDDSATEKAWQTELERLQTAVQRLGAINLAAIEESETLAERKDYLDQQNDDLTASLETLETAIRKIDRETRQRFKTTFDAVNLGLQELFPKVFGGGSAYLDLTDDDLLETGVTIMARPPGKKNSTIHLLSGGEKALTALSLVFAIFRLNPAPFCLLDEVDAPLDDANVGRFCRLVEEMSQSVQFIYISHNKVAMEMASHLAGVTMQEAGVSRLVAVDIDEAVALTEAS